MAIAAKPTPDTFSDVFIPIIVSSGNDMTSCLNQKERAQPV